MNNDVTGYIVRSKAFPELNGKKVVKTVKKLKIENMFTLWEVILDDNKQYQLYDSELW